jgi:hypothetical protein
MIAVGAPRSPIRIGDLVPLARISADRLRRGLTPASVTAPTITGTAQSGQTLSAQPGIWLNAPTTFGFQWQRCDPTGASCGPIDGATASAYIATEADVGATLVVTVTGANKYGSATATSAPTEPVVAAAQQPAAARAR